MPNCKFCGQPVMAGPVHHSACWETAAKKIAEEFCEDYCKWREKCGEDQEALDERCADCPMTRMVNLGL